MQRSRAALVDVASYLPAGRLTNEMLCERIENWTPEKVSLKTGIDTRCMAADDEWTSDMGIQAARNLFAKDPSYREGIDLLILVTVTADHTVPCTASFIQRELELPTSVGALDIFMGCSGYTYALGMAAGMLESRRARKVLLVTSDRFLPYTEYADQGVLTLFGDGASATLLERVDDDAARPPGAIVGHSSYGTDGTGAENIIIPTGGLKGFMGEATTHAPRPTVEMAGHDVFDFALKLVPGHIREVLADCGYTVPDVDLFVFHQANAFMLEHLRRRLKIPEERFVLHMAEVGNTVSSSIPLALDAARQAGRIQPGHRVLLTAFGTGYSWGSVLLDYPPEA